MKLTDMVKCEKVFWKEIVKGAISGIVWCLIIFIIAYLASDTLITVLENITKDSRTFWKLFIIMTVFFIIIGINIKIFSFLLLQAKKEKK